jgi:cytochrome b6-f complex iron-sulfur subunit
MEHEQAGQRSVTRRSALIIAAGGTLGAAALAACGDGESAGGAGGGYGAPGPTKAGSNTPAAGSSPTGSGAGGRELVRLADVPVGGAVSAKDQGGAPVIVAQPREGQVVAFSAICTHRGCTVAPQDQILKCPCHGSTFDSATGRNTGGPAPKPLAEVAVRVDGDSVVEA